jgi:Fe-S oxidoreductase
MEPALISPADAHVFGIPALLFSLMIPAASTAVFAFILAKRMAPLVRAAPDPRRNRALERLWAMTKYAVGQYRQPRYRVAGVLHIIFFAGFMIISLRSITLVLTGISAGYHFPGLSGQALAVYSGLKDIASTLVLAAAAVAIYRRLVVKPLRYAVPPRYGKDHTPEAVFILLMICGLMISDSLFEGSLAAAQIQKGMPPDFILPASIAWIAAKSLGFASADMLQRLHLSAYFAHELIFFSFLCVLPLGKHFHIITSLPNVYWSKLDKGSVKPVRWDISEDRLVELESVGVKHFEEFTWKHMLDFYSCADCGRCSDQCPANAVGRPLSPRFISIKCRDFSFAHYPIAGGLKISRSPLIGSVLEEHEIWSCTTCGACEEECPLLIEYIDKIVDLRRGMVDEGMVPQSLQKPLQALEKRGNPFGKIEKKRGDWAREKAFSAEIPVTVIGDGKSPETLYFVDSITSYDERIQNIARSTARLLFLAGHDFGILGPREKDSGHEVRRFGEELLFQELRDHNTRAIRESGVGRIVTADPHAFNALKNDYAGIAPVEHISQVLARCVSSGVFRLKPLSGSMVYTYHDPCYLGRHNGLYDIPRMVLDHIPGMKRVEMVSHCRDRSFCCGGGGLSLFYEAIEEKRMGQVRVNMAAEAGASVIITACPFCLINLEDAVKTTGMEGAMQVMDLTELVAKQLETGSE